MHVRTCYTILCAIQESPTMDHCLVMVYHACTQLIVPQPMTSGVPQRSDSKIKLYAVVPPYSLIQYLRFQLSMLYRDSQKWKIKEMNGS
jgi:hypothetical protein